MSVAKSKLVFGKEYLLQESSENTVVIDKVAENWKNAGHSVARYKFKKTGSVIHLYVSRFKTRSY